MSSRTVSNGETHSRHMRRRKNRYQVPLASTGNSAMFSLRDYAEGVRKNDLLIDFVSITIWQPCANGLKLSGHGLVKINASGALLCDFICTNATGLNLDAFGESYQFDNEDDSKNLKFIAVDIQGKTWEAENFALHLTMMSADPPFKCEFFLSEIVHCSKQTIPVQQQNYLWFESLESSYIPKNKVNTIKDTLTGESFKRNQTKLDLSDFEVSIIDQQDYTTVYANGNFDIDSLFEALKFYIGFTSGTMPSAYVLTTRAGDDMKHHIRSINKKINQTRIPRPINHMLMLSLDEWNDPHHFKLLQNILVIQKKLPRFFNSTVSQWKRVWQGFNATQSITALTLTVSIEGLLIDLFIPELEAERADADFENQKNEIIKTLKKTEINSIHLETIITHVMRWGNIHANAALKILAEKGLITKNEVKAWVDLRNSSAHPKFAEMTAKREAKERGRLMRCLTLFYKLNLNIYGYTGAYTLYEPNEVMDVMMPAVEIFNVAFEPSNKVE
ncbi:hypothetical protein [Pseudomonas sp. FH4]|uniref:hypothetical protein n=1 Tax=Pseudomonas sp. FH4 TaxID=1284393 RepID=UPI0012E2A019|nr:hypothetical protein [Pseudomonas sp. FH4]